MRVIENLIRFYYKNIQRQTVGEVTHRMSYIINKIHFTLSSKRKKIYIGTDRTQRLDSCLRKFLAYSRRQKRKY
jgi:hypothetical protein